MGKRTKETKKKIDYQASHSVTIHEDMLLQFYAYPIYTFLQKHFATIVAEQSHNHWILYLYDIYIYREKRKYIIYKNTGFA